MTSKVIAGSGVRKSGLALARGLGVKLLTMGSTLDLGGRTIINYGSPSVRTYVNHQGARRIINSPEAVQVASSKIKSLEKLSSEFCVQMTTDKYEAFAWLEEGIKVVARTLDRGNSGRGVAVFLKHEGTVAVIGGDETINFNDALFYTKYFPSSREYRIHCGRRASDGKVVAFDFQRKGLRTDEERPDSPDFTVRNHQYGFTFVRDEASLNFEPEMKARAGGIASLAVEELGLDFGAVDLRINNSGTVKIIEVNTAPGLSGTTLENYVNFFGENFL